MMRRIWLLIAAMAAVAACNPVSERRPVIGISCSRSESGTTRLGAAYSESVVKAGGVALVIPTVGSASEADAVLDVLDALVLSGGDDVNPAMYGEAVLNGTVHFDPVRDRSDSLLVRGALSRGMPILAICRGEQLMNVLLGGALYQDLPSQIRSDYVHGGGAMHPVVLEKGSLVRELFGRDTLVVNSYHHQAVKEAAPGVKVSARAPDGIVEALEADGILAVQFHPEKLVSSGDDSFLAPFQWLVEAAR